MSMNKTMAKLGAAFVSVLAMSVGTSALAGEWEICDLKVQVRDKQTNRAELQTRVLEAKPVGSAECPEAGSALSFRPETEDYQTELPRRQWPKPGKTIKVRYRYLDGECKDRGPCRIPHYSPILR